MSYFELAIRSIKNSDLDSFEHLISQNPSVIRQKDINGESLLILSCLAVTRDEAIPKKRGTNEQFTVVELLLNAGVNPSETDAKGRSPLHVAAISGHFEITTRCWSFIRRPINGCQRWIPTSIVNVLC